MSHTGIEPAVAPRVHRRITNEQSPSVYDPNASGGAITLAVSRPIRPGRAVHSRTPISLGFRVELPPCHQAPSPTSPTPRSHSICTSGVNAVGLSNQVEDVNASKRVANEQFVSSNWDDCCHDTVEIELFFGCATFYIPAPN